VKRLVVATRNAGKLREVAAALAAAGIEAVGLAALGDAAGAVEETGASFEANARLKAEAASRHTDLPVLADDSGLEVDALGGEPGVRSARWGGAGCDDAGRNRRLLEALRGVPAERRAARFRCVLAVARHGATLAVFEGTVEGRISTEPRGSGGFGYDPVFCHPPSGKTFGELTAAEKGRCSHRGRALAALVAALRERPGWMP
jgi:XTP/dITP diphosphohydrolase